MNEQSYRRYGPSFWVLFVFIVIVSAVALFSFTRTESGRRAETSVIADTVWAPAIVEDIRPAEADVDNPRSVAVTVLTFGFDAAFRPTRSSTLRVCDGYFRRTFPARTLLSGEPLTGRAVEAGFAKKRSGCKFLSIRPYRLLTVEEVDSAVAETSRPRSAGM